MAALSAMTERVSITCQGSSLGCYYKPQTTSNAAAANIRATYTEPAASRDAVVLMAAAEAAALLSPYDNAKLLLALSNGCKTWTNPFRLAWVHCSIAVRFSDIIVLAGDWTSKL